MTIGKDGNRVYVNSQQSLSRDKVLEAFGEHSTLRGDIPRALIEKEYGPDAILGRVEIRERFRELYQLKTGSPIGAERARQLLHGYEFDYWRSTPITRQSSLQAWAEDKRSEERRVGKECRL